jgi:hypothetical protein
MAPDVRGLLSADVLSEFSSPLRWWALRTAPQNLRGRGIISGGSQRPIDLSIAASVNAKKYQSISSEDYPT